MSDKKYIAAFDFGTGSVKAALIGLDATVLAHAGGTYPLLTPQSGWAEQRPEDHWQGVCSACRSAVAKGGIAPEDVVGVVFGGMWKGVVPVDKNGSVLHNAIIWLDARSEKQARELNEKLHTDFFCAAEYWPRLLWLKENEPEAYENAEWILENISYLAYRATGNAGTALSNCMTSSLKPELDERYRTYIRAAELDESKFPPCRLPWDKVGGLTEKSAADMGLCPDTPVFAGCGDIPAVTVGSGAGANGAAHIYMGSSGWLAITVPERVAGVGEHYSSLDDKKEIRLYTMQSVCLAFDWAVRTFYKKEWEELGDGIYGLIEKELAEIPAGCGGLIATPWLYGERNPLSGNARGLYFNINSLHDRRHFVAAMQEGIAYMLRMKLETYYAEGGAPLPLIHVVGGATGSARWMQTLCDVLQVPLEVPAGARHAGALGTAYCAMIGLGVARDFEEANQIIRTERRYEPREENRAVYEKNYQQFVKLFPQLEQLFDTMNG